MLSVSRIALGRVLALLVLLGVCLVALAALLIIRSWVWVVLGLTVSLLALYRGKLVMDTAVRVREKSERLRAVQLGSAQRYVMCFVYKLTSGG